MNPLDVVFVSFLSSTLGIMLDRLFDRWGIGR